MPDDPIARLFRAAAATPVDIAGAPAFGLETRVLAAWRSSSRGASLWDMGVLVRGLVLAGILMAVSIWPAMERANSNSDSENLQLADSSVQTDWTP